MKMDKPWLKHYEEGVPATIDYPDMPLHAALEKAVISFADTPAIVFFNRQISYRELGAAVNRLAAGLQQLGVKKGDRVALYLPNCPQFVIAYYATAMIGGVVVPCNPLYGAKQIEHQINDAGAETVIVLSRFYDNIRQVRANTQLKRVVVTNIKEYFPGLLKFLFTLLKEAKEGHRVDIGGDASAVWFQSLLASAPAKPDPVEVRPGDTLCFLYTGGTTGVPKGAQLTHRNVLVNAIQTRHWVPDVRPGKETILSVLPFFHSYGMTTCMNLAVVIAGTMLLLPQFKIEEVLKTINKHKPTLFPGVPTMYVAVNNYPGIAEYDVSSVRACISGAAGLPVEVQQRFQELTGGRLVEGYGLSEASPVTHGNPVYGENRIGTIGLPFPDTEAKIVDLDAGEKELPPGAIGELCVRGPQVMKGYWNMPTETVNVLRGGWLYTGDIAKMDEDGYFQIVDRKKDMIIAGGFNIFPRNVEEVLYQYPKVEECVAAGVPDEYRGETLKVYIVLKEGEAATAEEIIQFCRDSGQLAKYEIPRMVEFRSELPKTMVGKILRRMLVEEEREELAGRE